MPFGSFTARERNAGKKAPVASAAHATKPVAPVTGKSAAVITTKLNILLIGRNMEQIREYLCSANTNMTQALHGQGMTYYTRELAAITDVVSRKKKLEQFFWNTDQENWCYQTEQMEAPTYTFSISPSGVQKMVLDLVIRCSVPGQEVDTAGADICWILADGMVLDDTLEHDSYRAYIADKLRQFCGGENASMPVVLLLSQIEKWGHFDSVNGATFFPSAAFAKLMSCCKDRFAACVGKGTTVPVIPVQVYGGLEYRGADANGQPVLQIGQSGYYQSYIPEGCEVPGLYTIVRLCAAGENSLGEDLLHAARGHFAVKYANAGWQPVYLGVEAEL